LAYLTTSINFSEAADIYIQLCNQTQ
jgi:hypothetical protein